MRDGASVNAKTQSATLTAAAVAQQLQYDIGSWPDCRPSSTAMLFTEVASLVKGKSVQAQPVRSVRGLFSSLTAAWRQQSARCLHNICARHMHTCSVCHHQGPHSTRLIDYSRFIAEAQATPVELLILQTV